MMSVVWHFCQRNGRVFFRVILGFHLPSLWIPIHLFNWLKSASFLPVSPGDPRTKRTSMRSQVRWNRTGLCSLIFTSSLGLCRGGRGGRSEWPHQETAHSSTGATMLSPYCTNNKKKEINCLMMIWWKKFNFYIFLKQKWITPLCVCLLWDCAVFFSLISTLSKFWAVSFVNK